MSIHTIQNSFAGGEIAPSLAGRCDLAKYMVSLKRCENWLIHPHGGVSRRMGMRYITQTKYPDKPCRMVSFQYNLEQSYILEFGAEYVRFFTDGIPILGTDGKPYEVTTPYQSSDVFELNFTQSADVLFLVHPNYPPMELWRSSADEWKLDKFAYYDGPFTSRDDKHKNTMLAFSNTTSEITVTSNADLFKPGHVGSIWSVTHMVDELLAKTSGSVASTQQNTTLTSYTIVLGGRTAYYLDVPSSVKEFFVKGRTFTYLSQTYTVTSYTGIESAKARIVVTPYLAIAAGTDISVTFTRPTNNTWGIEMTVYDAWHLESNGFWYGTVVLERYNKDEDRWVVINTYTSGLSDTSYSVASAKNYSDSGEVSEPTVLRIRALTSFNTWVPSGNAEADRGYFQLSRLDSVHTGYLKISQFISGTQVKANVQTELYAAQSTVNWQEGVWSDYRGYPAAVGFYQERMVFANSPHEPQTLWQSRTGDYYDFSVSTPIQDDDAINATIASRQVNAIRHFIPLNDLIIMTSGGEWKLSAGGSGAITPTNIDVRPQGYRGSADIDPIVVGQMILFVQTQQARVRDLGYSYDTDSYTGNDLTVLANHLFESNKVVDWAYQQEPDSVCWIVRDDGLLCSLTYLREHDVVAWGRHPTDGMVESVATVRGDPGDDAYFIVSRDGVRCVELLEQGTVTSVEESFFVDCGTTVRDESGITEVTGLERLEGKDVSVLADGSILADSFIVTGGKIDLSGERQAPKIVHVGLPYKSTLETLDLVFQRKDGTQLTRSVRVSKAVVRVRNTRGLWAGVSEDDMSPVIQRTTEPMGAPIALKTGDEEIRISSGYDNGRVILQVKDPLPASILALVLEAAPVA